MRRAFQRGIQLSAAIGVALALVLSVLAGSFAQTPKPTKVRIGEIGRGTDFAMMPITLADDKGFFKQEALDTEFINFKGGGELTTAFASGDIDLGGTGISTHSRGVTAGVPAKIVSQMTHYPANWGLMVVPESPMKSLSDLKKGAKLGISRAGSQTHFIGIVLAVQAGLKPDDITFVPLGTPQSNVSAMKAGQTDGFIGYSPTSITLQLKKEARMVADASKVLPNFSNYAIAATHKLIEQNPKAVSAALRATHRAIVWMKANPQETQKYMMKQLNLEPELAKAVYDTEIGNFTPDGTIDMKGAEYVIDASVTYGFYEKKPTLKDVVDTRFTPVKVD
jgi:NitT/TauT family transport system substrate-binding protein